MEAHSSSLVWEIPWTEEPGGLQSLGSQRVRHNSATKEQQQQASAISQVNVFNDVPIAHAQGSLFFSSNVMLRIKHTPLGMACSGQETL